MIQRMLNMAHCNRGMNQSFAPVIRTLMMLSKRAHSVNVIVISFDKVIVNCFLVQGEV